METNKLNSEVSLQIVLLSTDKAVLGVFEKVLQKFGHRTCAVTEPVQALQHVQQQELTEPVDLLFIDYEKYLLDCDTFIKAIQMVNRDITIRNLPAAFLYQLKATLDRIAEDRRK